ncbi:hypothetical protein CHLRE_10g460350v5 [Chlamydomonas reinhardtii]|uniref:Phospholipid/glycerol acyltransferase domain-containing protein n=1 Tax=Chlamydomonas reinhardtii TaxID=3055 RepID=A0A2K3DBU6_CHLRE|nr:uncharacterized protein CHLRE_10g460350v5 [Chlamydomonas reinhardtii]PNW78002.1 hypothetical protein CHLRE_10g460350v5 [Chlamydomonas reinhardtii]
MKLRDSPFLELGCPFTAYEALKMLLLLPWVPLRLCLGGAALVALAVINSAAAWGVPPDQPLPAWRRNVVLASKELVGVVLWALGFRVRVAGRRHLQQALQLGAVGVFNHASWVDAFLLVWLMAPSGVSKADNAQLPVIGSAVRALQTVFIPYEKLSKQRRAGGASAGANGGSSSSSSGSSSSDSLAAGDSSAAAATQPATAAAVAGASGHASDPSPGLGVSSAGLTGFVGAVAEAATGEAACRQPAAASSVLQQRRRQTASAASKHTTGSSTGNAATLLGHAGADAGGGAKASKGCSNGRASSSSSSSSSSSAFIVQGNVTEVLLQRVRHPSYCRPGGYPIVVMAPEGTTANGRGLLRFRTGAFVLGRPVLPICIKYRFRGANPAWTMGDARWNFLRLLCQWRNDLEVTLLPPMQPNQQELREPALFAARVRSAMADCLQVPLVDACHDHYLALRRAGLRGVSWDGRRLEAEPGAPLWRLCERRQPRQEQGQEQEQETGQGQGQEEGAAGVEHPAGPGACGVAGGGEGAATGSDAGTGKGRGGGGDEGARRQPLGPGGRACVPLEELEMADVLALAAQLEA